MKNSDSLTNDFQNLASLPANAPKGWQGGLHLCAMLYAGLLLVLSMGSCEQHKENRTESSGDSEDAVHRPVDSIVFRTSNEEFVYLGERLYPPSSDSDSINKSTPPGHLSIERVGDTLFVFLNNDMLYDRENVYFPPVSDSLIRHPYAKYYNVEIDDDLPYMVYLKSSKDVIHLVKNRNNVFYWETATIRDTVLSVFGGLKVGMNTDRVFDGLGLPVNILKSFQRKDLSLILCHGSVPDRMWFAQKYGGKLVSEKPTIQVLLRFEKGQLESILIDPWIGYGAKEDGL